MPKKEESLLTDEERGDADAAPADGEAATARALEFEGKDEGPPPSCGKIFGLSRPEWPVLLFSLILMAISEGCGLAAPLILASAYDSAINQTTSADEKHAEVRDQMVFVFSLHCFGVLCGFLKGSMIGLAGERVVARLRTRLYRSVIDQEVAFFDERKSGELVSRLGSDTTIVQTATTSSLPDFVGGLAKVIAAMALMFSISSTLTSVILGVAPWGHFFLLFWPATPALVNDALFWAQVWRSACSCSASSSASGSPRSRSATRTRWARRRRPPRRRWARCAR